VFLSAQSTAARKEETAKGAACADEFEVHVNSLLERNLWTLMIKQIVEIQISVNPVGQKILGRNELSVKFSCFEWYKLH
jgi:hypothetical protein